MLYFWSDIREAKIVQGRSINLALSHRGRQALSRVGMEEKVWIMDWLLDMLITMQTHPLPMYAQGNQAHSKWAFLLNIS